MLPSAFFHTVALYCSELQWADFLRILPWMLHSLRAEVVLCSPFYPSAQHDFWLHSKHSGNICLVNKWEKIKYSYPFMHLLFLFGFCISHLTRQKLMCNLWHPHGWGRQERDHIIVAFTLTYSFFSPPRCCTLARSLTHSLLLPPFSSFPSPSLVFSHSPRIVMEAELQSLESLEFETSYM